MSSAATVVEFFQAVTRRRRSVPQTREQLELQATEAHPLEEIQRLDDAVRIVEELLLSAFDVSHLDRERAADRMFISSSLLGRQLQRIDNQHISLQRLWLLPDDFWREFLVLVIKKRNLGRVGRTVEGL